VNNTLVLYYLKINPQVYKTATTNKTHKSTLITIIQKLFFNKKKGSYHTIKKNYLPGPANLLALVSEVKEIFFSFFKAKENLISFPLLSKWKRQRIQNNSNLKS
jgi:hypothetical protein